jgi:hypothetical protein
MNARIVGAFLKAFLKNRLIKIGHNWKLRDWKVTFDKYKQTMAQPEEHSDPVVEAVANHLHGQGQEEPKKAARYNAGKNMLDLIPPEFEEELGFVFTKGAVKYSVKGDCDCIVHHVTELSRSIRKQGYVDIAEKFKLDLSEYAPAATRSDQLNSEKIISATHVITYAGKKIMQIDTKSNKDELDQNIERNIESGIGNISQSILSNESVTGVEHFCEYITSHPMSLISCWLKKLVLYAAKREVCRLTTITLQGKSEKDYADLVISHLDSLSELIGQIKHLPICGSMKILRSGVDNWKQSVNTDDHDLFVRDRVGSLKRHLLAYRKGEFFDPDRPEGYTGPDTTHLGHVAWNALAILWYYLNDTRSNNENIAE